MILETDWLALGWEIIKSLGKGIWDGITSLFSSGKEAGEQTASGFASGMSSEAGNIAATTQDEVMNGFKMDLYNQGNTTMATYNGGLTGTAPIVTSTVQGVSSDIESTMSQTDLYSSGASVMQGFREGMESQRSAIIGTAKDIANSVKSTIDSSLQIHSPSKVTEQSGINTAQGVIKGVTETLPEVKKSSEELGNTYRPETDRGIIKNNNTTSNDTYSPTFNLTINNTGNDREMEFKVKQWLREGMEDMARGLSRRNPRLREV